MFRDTIGLLAVSISFGMLLLLSFSFTETRIIYTLIDNFKLKHDFDVEKCYWSECESLRYSMAHNPQILIRQ